MLEEHKLFKLFLKLEFSFCCLKKSGILHQIIYEILKLITQSLIIYI